MHHDHVSLGLSLTRRLAHASGGVVIEARRGVLRGGRCREPRLRGRRRAQTERSQELRPHAAGVAIVATRGYI